MHQVVERVGKAESTLQSIIEEEGGNSYDFAFIGMDANRMDSVNAKRCLGFVSLPCV